MDILDHLKLCRKAGDRLSARAAAEIEQLRAELAACETLNANTVNTNKALRAELEEYKDANAVLMHANEKAEAKLERVRETAKGALRHKLGGDLSAFTYHEALKSIAGEGD